LQGGEQDPEIGVAERRGQLEMTREGCYADERRVQSTIGGDGERELEGKRASEARKGLPRERRKKGRESS